MTRKVVVQNLQPGQEVSIANCRVNGIVVRRVMKNLYAVNWEGREINVSRLNLGVNVNGIFKFGAVNAS